MKKRWNLHNFEAWDFREFSRDWTSQLVVIETSATLNSFLERQGMKRQHKKNQVLSHINHIMNNLQKDQRLQFPQRSRNLPSKIVVIEIQADEALQVCKFRRYSSLDVVFVQLPVSIIRQCKELNLHCLLHNQIS